MTAQELIESPQLDPPGAGLPKAELFFARILFSLYRVRHSREEALRHFRKEAEALLNIVKNLSPDVGRRRVLIKRVAGIEDSSRFWSPYMVLHHLVIVDNAISGVVEALVSNGTNLPEAKIADVKPFASSGPEIVSTFQKVVADYENRLTKISDLRNSTAHIHPWFGPLNAHGWHCLAAVHHTIHKRQLEAILSTVG